jgi:hypothetical protein
MGLLDAVKEVNEAAAEWRDAKLNAAISKVNMEAMSLAEEVVRLRNENLELRTAARLRATLTFHDNVYWRVNSQGKEDGPFCQKCWEGSDRLVSLIDDEPYHWRCSVCNEVPWKPGGQKKFYGNQSASSFDRDDSDWG